MAWRAVLSRWRGSRALQWTLGVSLGVAAALGLVLFFMLAQATGNRELYERHYALLFAINIALAGLLLAVIVWLLLRMAVRLKQRKFGSRLLVKLAAIFALVGLLPRLLIYAVSYQFVTRSIESWFDVQVKARSTPACSWAAPRSTARRPTWAPAPGRRPGSWPTAATARASRSSGCANSWVCARSLCGAPMASCWPAPASAACFSTPPTGPRRRSCGWHASKG